MFTSGIITLPCVEIEFCKIIGVLRTLRDQVYLICKNSIVEDFDALFKITFDMRNKSISNSSFGFGDLQKF